MSKLIKYWLRGGSWNYFDFLCRSADRYVITPGTRVNYYGFRVVRGGGK